MWGQTKIPLSTDSIALQWGHLAMAESSQPGNTIPDSNDKHKLYKQLLMKMSKAPKPTKTIVPDREPWPPPTKNLARPHVRRNKASDLRTKRPLQPPPTDVLHFYTTHRDICHRGFLQRTLPPSVGALPRKQRQKGPTLLSPLSLNRPKVGLPKVLMEGLKKLTSNEEPSTRHQVTHNRTESGPNQTPSLSNHSLLYEISHQLDNRSLCEIAHEIESMSYKDRILKQLWDTLTPTLTQVSRNREPYPDLSNHLVIFSTILVVGILKVKALRDFWRSFVNAKESMFG